MYTDKELAQLISEVETEFSSYLAKAETTLAKSEDEVPAKKDDKKPEAKKEDSEEAPAKEAAPEKSDEAPAQDAAPAEGQEEAPAAPADEAPALDAAPADEGHGYDDQDMAAMTEMYSSMSRPELIAHHDAVKAALDAMTQAAPAAPAPDMQAAPAQDAPAAPMMKSEKDVTIEVPAEVVVANAETEILKSELAAKATEVSELKKNVEVLTTFVNKLFEKKSAPAGKAITALETIKKSEDGNSEDTVKTLTAGEITKRLNEKASDPSLKKSDRAAINDYYATGKINLNGISHLLK